MKNDRIERVQADGLKGESFIVQLDALNIIHGPNASGKTARLDAIRLALMGHLPEVGKTNDATMGIASSPTLSVSVRTKSGAEMSGTWKRGKKGAVQSTIVRTPEDYPETPTVLISARDYLTKSDAERVKYVASLVSGGDGDWTGEKVVEAMKSLDVGEITTELVRARDSLVEEVDQADRERNDTDGTVQELVEKLIEHFKGKSKLLVASIARLEGFVKGQAQVAQATSGDAECHNVEERLGSVRADLEVCQRSIKALKSDREKYERHVALKKGHEKTLATVKDHTEELTQLNERIAQLLAEPVPESKYQALSDRCVEARYNLRRTEEHRDRLRVARADAIRNAGELMKLQCCPTCKSSGTGWKAAFEADLEQRLAKIAEDDKAAAYREEADRQQVKTLEEATEAAAAIDKNSRRHQEELQNVQRREVTLRTEMDARKYSADSLEQMVPIPEPASAAELETKLRFLTSESERLRVVQARNNSLTAQRLLVQKANEELVETDASLKVHKAALKALATVHEAIVSGAFTSLMTKMNEVSGGLLKSPLAFHEGEIGRWDGGNWVSHKYFSGFERCVCYLAVSAALAAKAPIRVLMLDEMGIMTPDNRQAVMKRMQELVERNVIDQFIGVDTDRSSYSGVSVNLIPV